MVTQKFVRWVWKVFCHFGDAQNFINFPLCFPSPWGGQQISPVSPQRPSSPFSEVFTPKARRHQILPPDTQTFSIFWSSLALDGPLLISVVEVLHSGSKGRLVQWPLRISMYPWSRLEDQDISTLSKRLKLARQNCQQPQRVNRT